MMPLHMRVFEKKGMAILDRKEFRKIPLPPFKKGG